MGGVIGKTSRLLHSTDTSRCGLMALERGRINLSRVRVALLFHSHGEFGGKRETNKMDLFLGGCNVVKEDSILYGFVQTLHARRAVVWPDCKRGSGTAGASRHPRHILLSAALIRSDNITMLILHRGRTAQNGRMSASVTANIVERR